MSRAGAIGVVLGLVVLGMGAALALALLGDEDNPDTTDAPAGAGVTVSPVSSAPATSVPGPTTTRGEDPLCVAVATWQEALHGHLPVEGPDDLRVVRTATLAFYTEAVGYVEPPEQGAFAEFLVYEQASYDYSEANDWNPERPLEDLLEDPPPTPPQGATDVVFGFLEERCGLVRTLE